MILRPAFVDLVVRLLVLGCVVIGFLLWSAGSNRSLASQEGNSQCEYGTDALSGDTGAVRVVPTFHSFGVSWRPSGRSSAKTAYVLFGEVGSTEDLRRSLDLVYSSDDNEYRGSVVHLKSGTKYEIALFLDDTEIEAVIGETWCEQFPIAETVIVPTGTQAKPFKISGVVGSPDGYILYTADPDSSNTLDGESVTNNIVIENSAYVIVRGLTLKNAQRDAILVTGKGYTHDVVIEDNVIENWGRINAVSGFGERDSAIRTANGGGTNYERLIVQRNIIRNPRGDTNSWSEYREDQKNCTVDRCHPKGPGGLFFKQTAGNHVIRYNEISSTNGNYFFDGIGGADDSSTVGSLNKDTDVYGNIVSNVWDDAIETEGANANVRIWGNYIDNTYVAFANAVVSRGPLYIFRNVVYRTQRSPDASDNSGVFIKNKSISNGFGGGHVFVFHNTVYRSNQAGGVRTGISGTSTPLVNFTSRNNILDASNRVIASASSDLTVSNDFDYDLYQGTIKNLDGQEQHGIEAAAVYGNDPSSPYALANGALGHDDGIIAPNFSDHAVGAPDMGAQEYGAPPLEFGTSAYQTAYNGNQVPAADLSLVCVDLNCRFADRSTDADGTVVSWSWRFGDGDGTTLQNPSHAYPSAGKFTVTLIVADDGGATSEPALQTVTVSDPAVNEAPVADDKTVTTDQDTAVAFMLTGSDPEGDPLTFAVVNGPANGSLSGSSPNLIYTPNPGYIGSDSLTYTANDGTVDSAPATVSFTVAAVAEALAITDISPNTVQAGTTVEVLIRGTGFADGARVRFDQGSGPKPNVISVVVEDSNTLRVLIDVFRGGPKRKRFWDVIVASGGSTAILADGLTVIP